MTALGEPVDPEAAWRAGYERGRADGLGETRTEPADIAAKIEAIVGCGRLSGEHKPDKGPYYCCDKADALLALHAPGEGT